MVRLNPRSFKVVESGEMPPAANEPTPAEPVLGEPPRDPTVGDVLREAREASGQDLRDVARLLRIRYDYLQAIEDGRLEVLPGATYSVGFVRAYAQHLGLDSDRLLTRFRAEMGGLGRAKELVFPAAPPEGKFLSGSVIAFSLVLVVGAFAGWYYVNNQDRLSFDRVFAPEGTSEPAAPPEEAVAGTTAAPEVATVYEPPAEDTPPAADTPAAETPVADLVPEPAALAPVPEPAPAPEQASELAAAAPVPEPAADPTPPPALAPDRVPAAVVDAPVAAERTPELAAAAPSAEPAPEPETAVEVAPLQPIATAEASEAPQTAALPAVPESAAATGDGRVYGRPNRDARIVVTAVDDSWIQIEDGEQNVVFTRMLAAGDSYRVPNRGGLKLKTGNAGGLRIAVDGVDVPAIGARGEILQNVALSPRLLQAGQAGSP